MKVIFVAGLIHSGSTFFERLIASLPGCVGLGELQRTVRLSMEGPPSRPEICSCGEPHHECEFWGPLFGVPESDTFEREFERALHRFETLYPDATLVESSKRPERIEIYQQLAAQGWPIDLRVIYLFRDVRGWIHAIRRKGTADGDASGARKRTGLVRNAYYWWRRVAAERAFLRRSGVPCLTVSYESVVFGTEAELQRIADFLAVSLPPAESLMVEAHSHALHGNAMRKDASRNRRIMYDPVWIRDWRVFWATPWILPPIAYSTHLQRAHSAVITTKPGHTR